MKMAAEEIDSIVRRVRADFGVLTASSDRAWTRAPAVRVIDCVLSLNRNYDRFVVPRLNRFEAEQPHVRQVADLQDLIHSYSSPARFVASVLRYRHPKRGTILSSVTDRLLAAVGRDSAGNDLARLRAWANTADPADYRLWGISGFALAGFQYLRMLFDANTTKPDVHIIAYVSETIGRRVSAIEALKLLERAAEKGHFTLRDVDTNIWERSARAPQAITHPKGKADAAANFDCNDAIRGTAQPAFNTFGEERPLASKSMVRAVSAYHEPLAAALRPLRGQVIDTAGARAALVATFPALVDKQNWVILSDHCRNRTNKGACQCAKTDDALLEWVERGRYRVL